MSLTPEAQRAVIDYYFQEPNAKAVVEDGLDAEIQDVRDYLQEVYTALVEWVDTPTYHPGVGVGKSATTADLERMKRDRQSTTDKSLRGCSEGNEDASA